MAKIKVLVRDKKTLVLEEDAKKGDIICLDELSELDYSDIETLIEQGKDRVYESKLKEVEKAINLQNDKILINAQNQLNKEIEQLKAQIEMLKIKQLSELQNKENEVEKKYISELTALKKELSTIKDNHNKEMISEKALIEKTNENDKNILKAQYEKQLAEKESKYQELKNTQELVLKNKEAELLNKAEKDINELKISHQEEVTQLQNAINTLNRQKAALNVKQTGEDLEAWCDNEVRSYMQNGLFNCKWIKDNKIIKNEGELTGSKADFIFKVFASEECNEDEELTSICLDMKDENPDSVNKKSNADYYKALDKNREKKNCKYAVLVSNLEMDKANYLPMYKVREYKDMYVVRPAYMMTFLNMISSLSTRFSSIILTDKKERLEYLNITELMETFDDIKNTYLDKPLATLKNNLEVVVKQNEVIINASSKIKESCDKITRSYIDEITKKIDNFDVRINRAYKKVNK